METGHHPAKNVFRLMQIFTFSLFSILPHLGQAQESSEIKHGFELTFTNPRLIRYGNKRGYEMTASTENVMAREQWVDKMYAICLRRPAGDPEKCVVEKGKRRGSPFYTITYPDGFWYAVTVDPLVIEVIGKPLTIAEAKQNRNRMQRDIWNHALNVRTFSQKRPHENAGLSPHEEIGGGHIHFDLKTAFNGDSLLFRNFLVDFANHPTLALGSLVASTLNAPPIAVLPAEQQQAFADIIKMYDNTKPKMTIKQLAQLISEHVYKVTAGKPSIFRKWLWNPPQKYQALNVTRVVNDDVDDAERTIEIRSLRPEKSADEWISLITLFDARINKLKRYNKPIPFVKPVVTTHVMEKEPQRVINEFYAYVVSAGLDWNEYKALLPKELLSKVDQGKVSCKDYVISSGIGQSDANFKRIYDNLLLTE